MFKEHMSPAAVLAIKYDYQNVRLLIDRQIDEGLDRQTPDRL